ncbi:MAG TPA: hypothetical protein VN228_05640 [Pyrinomonadaceae bacterium]|nr:hypothetical protein [Pyrinomonadaceae bacterium]
MKFLKHMMTAVALLGLLSVGALADDQKHNQQKPPKQPKVVERPEKPPPPRGEGRGENRGRGGNDNRRGRP